MVMLFREGTQSFEFGSSTYQIYSFRPDTELERGVFVCEMGPYGSTLLMGVGIAQSRHGTDENRCSTDMCWKVLQMGRAL